jgi:general secretion pathway protein G
MDRRNIRSLRNTTPTGRRARRGFTLIEVMIVIAIVVALGGIVALSVLGRQKDADRKMAEIDMNTIGSAMKLFRFDFGRWPTEQEGLRVLWDQTALDAEAEASKWKKYLDKPIAVDRWGTAWNYRPVSEQGDQETYDLWSNGPDKIEGTEDDVTSWSKAAGEGGAETGTPAPATTGGN